jgi:orotidine-5'-phosphate decarboxylase
MSSTSRQPYSVRAQKHPNLLVRRLFEIAEAKKTNVTVSADVTTTKELLDLADRTSLLQTYELILVFFACVIQN